MKSRRIIPLILLAGALALNGRAGAEGEAEKAPPEQPKEPQPARVVEIELKLQDAEDPAAAFPFAEAPYNLREFAALVRQAASDKDVDGVLLKPGGYGVGWARLLEVRESLGALRASGKKLFVFLESMEAPDLVLASMADRVSMPESGSVFVPGMAIEILYMKRLLEKVHVRFDVIHIGEYKSAGETFVRDSMSPELKESLDPILDEFFDSMVSAIADGRRLSPDAVRQAIDKGIHNAKDAQAAGLIDRVEYEDQFKSGMKAYFPDRKLFLKKEYDLPGKTRQKLDPNNPMAALSMLMSMFAGGTKEKLPEGPKIAVVYCSGPIVSGKSQYGWDGTVSAMGSETIVDAIDNAASNDDVKALVLRVNSPGGSGLASDMIWRAVARAKEKKPVVTSMGDVAASGGYYIAMNSNVIVAEPQTITGSIGVVGMVPVLEGLLTWIGIDPQRLTRGKRAAGFTTLQGLSDDDREMLRGYMKAFYDDFVAKVAAGRARTPAEIEPIARGRVWTGRKAKELGLVDELGGLDRAIAIAREKGGIAGNAEIHILESPRRAGPFEMLNEMFGARASAIDAVAAEIPGVARLLERIRAYRTAGADGVCCASPELMDLMSPFGPLTKSR